jgi:hypothetical protein
LGQDVDSTFDVTRLFDPDEQRELRCLIILANAEGHLIFRGRKGELIERRYGALLHADEESEAIRSILRKQHALITQKSHVSLQTLRKSFTPDDDDSARNWDIVHFIGHTDVVDGDGYFILPGHQGGDVTAVEIGKLGPLMGNSHLLYLSSCSTARPEFALQLAHYGAPAIVGFRVGIDDPLAAQHAVRFYENLFATRRLEEAFRKTRRDLYEDEPQSRAWASAVMILKNNSLVRRTAEVPMN